LAGILLVGSSLAIGAPSAVAQGFGSLGGYGAESSYGSPVMGEASTMIIPYGGTFEGFMPSRMGGGSALSFRSRPAATMNPSRTPFRLSPMSGGMDGSLAGTRAMSPLGPRGTMGLGGGAGLGGMRPMSRTRGTSVMPPTIGYPFRQPPSLVSPSSSATGMSM
jgi:hypothetical protein